MAVIGKAADLREVKARWAYAELGSDRFGAKYDLGLCPGVRDSFVSGVPFEALTAVEQRCLALSIENHPDRSGLVVYLNKFVTFRCVGVTLAELEVARVVPDLSTVPHLCTFGKVFGPYLPTDPRSVRDRTPSAYPLPWREPIILVPYDGSEMILEGTSRSLIFLRDAAPGDVLPAWRPILPSNVLTV